MDRFYLVFVLSQEFHVRYDLMHKNLIEGSTRYPCENYHIGLVVERLRNSINDINLITIDSLSLQCL